MRVDNKNFYFDIGQNNRGIYMRISEVSGTYPPPPFPFSPFLYKRPSEPH